MAEIKQLETIAAQVRRDIIRMVASAASGHPGGSLGKRLLLRVRDLMGSGDPFRRAARKRGLAGLCRQSGP